MEAQEVKKLLDQVGVRIVKKFVQDQQTALDSFKAEVSRSLDSILGILIKEIATKKQATPKPKEDPEPLSNPEDQVEAS